MSWVLVVGAGWLVGGAVLAVIVGRSIRLADAKALGQKAAAVMATRDEPNFVVDQPVVNLGPATIPSFDAQMIDLPVPRDVPPARPPITDHSAPSAEREPMTREHGLA